MTFKVGDQVRIGDDDTVWTVAVDDGTGYVWLHRAKDQVGEEGRTESVNIMNMVWVGADHG